MLIVALTTLGASVSLITNLLAAYKAPPAWRKMFLVVASFSLIYVIAWGWLLVFPDTDRGVWSASVTPASMASFFAVWTGPSLMFYFNHYTPRGSKDDQ